MNCTHGKSLMEPCVDCARTAPANARDTDPDAVIQTAARLIMGAALDLIQADPHSWSERGCATCQAVGVILRRPFGCYAYAIQRRKERERKGT